MAERRESCHRDTQECLHQGALSSQGSSKLKKLHKTEKEKRERTEKGITSKLEVRTNGGKTALFGKRGSRGTRAPQSWTETSKKLYRRREKKNKTLLLPLHWPAMKPSWSAKWENRSSLSPSNLEEYKSYPIIPQYDPQSISTPWLDFS